MALVLGNTEGNARIIRDAMLDAEANWLREVDRGETLTQRTIARVIADAFHNEAAKYKTKEMRDDDESRTDEALPSLGEGS